MTIDIRLSPSGPVIATMAEGARLRLTETNGTMGGESVVIPTVPDLICPDGFGETDAYTLQLGSPKEGLEYRAKLALDVNNFSTDSVGTVFLYLDTSVDGGVTWTNRVVNSHQVDFEASGTHTPARMIEIWMPLTLGTSLGVDEAVPTPNLRLRARAAANASLAMEVYAPASATLGAGTVTGLAGTIHLELEECLG